METRPSPGRKDVNFLEFTRIYLNVLEFAVLEKRVTDRQTNQPTDGLTDGQSLLYICFSQLNKFVRTKMRLKLGTKIELQRNLSDFQV